MKKFVMFLLIILCLGCICGGYYLFSLIDRTAPVIVVQDKDSKMYRAGMTASDLLAGVTAIDDKSGDVSDTLQVESVSETSNPNQVEVVYTAKDKSGNNVRLTYTMNSDGSEVNFVPGQNSQEASGETADSSVTAQTNTTDQSGAASSAAMPIDTAASDGASAVDTQTADTQTSDEQQMEGSTGSGSMEDTLRAEAENAIAQLSPEAPRIRLSKYYEEILHGTEMNLMYYVSQLEDDADSVDNLIGRIQVLSDVNIDVPGTYHVTYYTMDSNGHQSNMATLTVRVL